MNCITHFILLGEMALFLCFVLGFSLYESKKKKWNRRPILLAIFAFVLVSVVTFFFEGCKYDVSALLLNAIVGVIVFALFVVQIYIGTVRSRRSLSVDEAMLSDDELNAPPIEDEDEPKESQDNE